VMRLATPKGDEGRTDMERRCPYDYPLARTTFISPQKLQADWRINPKIYSEPKHAEGNQSGYNVDSLITSLRGRESQEVRYVGRICIKPCKQMLV
jgi:hypothetical protein